MDREWSDGAAVSSPTASSGEGKVGAGSDGVSADSPMSTTPVVPAMPAGGRRRSANKRVVTVPLADVSGPRPKGVGEGNTSTDEWAWRKYGQKPIKGSPFPRAYYRCSSSKGCPARKQVERSRADPDKVVVTYSFEHNHSAAVSRAQNRQAPKPMAQGPVPPEPPAEDQSVSAGTHDVVAACATEGCGAGAAVEVHDEFRWLYDGVSVTSSIPPSDADEMLYYGPMFFGAAAVASAPAPFPDELGDVGALFGRGAAEEDAMFAGLGELPECAMVFRRRAEDGLTTAGGVKVEPAAEGAAITS